jgi:ABC-type polysaccharide/polyol phosphate export permease
MLFSGDMAVASEVPSTFRSSAIRPGPIALVRLGFGELAARRRLIRYLVQADLKKKGSDTLLGNVWWVIDPLLQMVVYLILVTVIFDRKIPDYPLFLFGAILPW